MSRVKRGDSRNRVLQVMRHGSGFFATSSDHPDRPRFLLLQSGSSMTGPGLAWRGPAFRGKSWPYRNNFPRHSFHPCRKV